MPEFEQGVQLMIYLASPYSHPNERVRHARFDAACTATAELMRSGQIVFSPTVHGHPLVRCQLPFEWSYWERFNRDFLCRCDELVVLMLDGWEASEGVRGEIQIAKELRKPMTFAELTMLKS